MSRRRFGLDIEDQLAALQEQSHDAEGHEAEGPGAGFGSGADEIVGGHCIELAGGVETIVARGQFAISA